MSTSSARPDDLDAFATGSRAADDELRSDATRLVGDYNAFLGDTSWGYFDIQSLLGGFGEYIGWNETDARWVAQIAAAFRSAGGDGSIATLPDAAILASLRAAGLDGDRGSVTFDDPVAFGFPPTTGYANDPVNTATGNFVELEVDLPFGGLVGGLRFARTYNSRSTASGAFGPGWSSWANARLHARPEGAELTGPDGQRAIFPSMGAGYGRVVGVNALVEPLPSGLALRWFGGDVWEFDDAGLPLAIRRGPGTEVRLLHDNEHRLVGLVHANGSRIDVRWKGERIAGLACSDGRTASYRYDEHGCLVEVLRGGGASRRYDVDERARIVAVVDADGVVEVRNEYDDDGRVVQQLSPFGRRTRFAYLPGRVTVMADGEGANANTYVHDASGRMLAIVDGEGQRLSLNYDAWGNPVAITERNGAVTVQEWDDRARLVRRVVPSGAEFAFTYDDADRVVEVTTSGGAVTRYRYVRDERSPVEIVDPEGGVTRMTVEGGLVRRIIDPDGVELQLDFDDDGNVIATTDGDGNTARLERDPAGRVIAAVTPLGHRTTFVHDAAGLPVERRDPAGGVWRSEYSAAGRLTAVVDPTRAREEVRYGEHGLAAATVDALGHVTELGVDAFGNVNRVVAPDGGATNYAYDPLSRLTAITDPAGATWQREYDVNGNLVGSVDPTGVHCTATVDHAGRITGLDDGLTSSAFEFDELGRTLAHIRPDGAQQRAEYDRCGRRVAITDPSGGRTRLEYTPGGRVRRVVSPSGRAERYEHDRCGRVSARIDAAGRRWEFRYDADGAVVERIAPGGEAERVTYDAAGRVLERSAPGIGVISYDYDPAGRPVRITDRLSGTREFGYDSAGRLVSATDANGQATRYAYHAQGRLTETTDPLGATTTRRYDEAGRLVEETDPLGRATTTTYDAAGRMIERVDGSGRRASWTYDASGRVATFGAAGSPPMTVQRDALGREIALDEPGGLTSTRLRWDEAGRLVERTRGELAMRWRYGADGERLAIGYPDGTETTYDYDAGGYLVGKRHTGLGALELERDPAGRLVGARGDGMRARWRYEHGELTGHEIEVGGRRRTTSLERDPIGRVVAAITDDAARRFTYDAVGQLVAAETPAGLFTFTYDEGGRLRREASAGGIIEYEHDSAGQLVRRSASGGPHTRYEYDGAGRRVREEGSGHEREYAFDELGGLSAITVGDTTTPVAVDALGELAQVGATALLWDSADPLAPLAWIGERAVIGDATPLALAGDAGHEWLAPDWQGTIDGAAPRDPWGAATPSTEQRVFANLGYRGEVELSGDVWLRNRIHQPGTRSFLQPDPLPAVPGTGCAANPYNYAANDPVGRLDPVGLRPVTEAELQEYRDGMNRNVWQQAGDFVTDNWEYIAAGAMIVGGVALMFTGVGGPAGVALMAASGGLIAAGGSAAIQRYTTGEVDWGRVAVDGAIGAVTAGAISGAVTLAPRVMASSLFARGATPALSSRLGGATETFYRGMSNAELAGLSRTGALSVRGESFVTQNLPYVEQLAARHPNLYQTIVRFEMQPGTQQALVSAGARSPGRLLVDEGLGHLPMISRGMPNVVHVKAELDAINYGLRPGSAEIFNSRILGFGPH